MAPSPQRSDAKRFDPERSDAKRFDPERSRRRLELLAALAQAKSTRESIPSPRLRGLRLRELIATRRRPAN